jgi:hypothetical protein
MTFKLTGLAPDQFAHWFGMDDPDLTRAGIARVPAGAGFPCRVSLRDAHEGEPVLILNHEHHRCLGPYRASGPIFVSRSAQEALLEPNEIPPEMRGRLYSGRGYAAEGNMVDADVCDGRELEGLIERLFDDPQISFIHLHHARRGCFACRVDRA